MNPVRTAAGRRHSLHRSVPVHDGPDVLPPGPAREALPVRLLLPGLPGLRRPQGRLLHQRRAGVAAGLDAVRALRCGRDRVPESADGDGGQAALRGRLPRLARAQRQFRKPLHARGARGARGASERAADRGDRPARGGADPGDLAAEPPQLPDPDRHQGRTGARERPRPADHRVRHAARPRQGRHGRDARGPDRRGGFQLERGAVAHHGPARQGHARPQHGAGLPGARHERARRLPGVRRNLPGRLRAAGGHDRHARQRHPQRDRGLRGAPAQGAPAHRHPAGFGRPRAPGHPGRAHAEQGRFPGHVHRALQRAGRAEHLADPHPDRAGGLAQRPGRGRTLSTA